MNTSEYTNLRRKIRRDFDKTQQNDLIDLLYHIQKIEEVIDRLTDISKNDQIIMSNQHKLIDLDRKTTDLKIFALAAAVHNAGVDIDYEKWRPKEEKKDEGIRSE